MKTYSILSLFLFILLIVSTGLIKDELIILGSLSNYGCDFDGDGLDDLSVWDPSTNTLYFKFTNSKKLHKKRFIKENIKFNPVFADYDGDKKTDFVFYQSQTGQWVSYLSSSPKTPVKIFLGNFFDMPVPVDINGDKKYSPAVWRPNTGYWLLPSKVHHQGAVTDLPSGADYDGDGKSDLAIWRTNSGYWYIDQSSTEYDPKRGQSIQHGHGWDIIVPNDYNRDGKCDLAVWSPEEQAWYFLYSGRKTKSKIKFGGIGDIPLSSDLNGDKVPELITWNPSKKSWNILNIKTQERFSYKWDVPNNCIPASSILQIYQ